MNIRALAANAIWAAASQQAWRRFRDATADPCAAQRAILAKYVADNADTVVGRQYGFAKLAVRPAADVVDAYRDVVPVTTYDELEPIVERIAAGERGVLTNRDVRRLAPSSGSTSAAKLVPYTDDLQREFSHAVDAWVADLYRAWPTLIGGPAYWSVTPSVSIEAVAAERFGSAARPAVPIGFEDDSAYLGGIRQHLVKAMLAVPDAIKQVTDPDAFRYLSLLFLLRAGDLRLMSVWHPSYLSRLLDAIPQWFDRLVADVARGTLTPPAEIPPGVHALLSRDLRPLPRRASDLKRLRSHGVRDLWPDLVLVSCWGDGSARPFATRLAEAMDGIVIQHKGLIATEAIVTIPFRGHRPVAVRSHFIEFIDPRGQSHLVHELERDVEYEPIVTTGGGLYRYRLGDAVTVDGWLNATPSLGFVGRADRVSDRFGEKLSDGFVTGVLESLFADVPAPRFAMLAPEVTARGWAYTLLVDSESPLPSALPVALDSALRRNPHYAWCVDLGQLCPARVVRVAPHADRAYVDACVARGQRLGDVKPVSLHPDNGWEARLGIKDSAQSGE